MPARPALRAVALVVAAGLFLAGCGGSGSDAGASPRVVASIAPIADLASRVAKGRGSVTILVPPGANAHTYQPKPSDARQLAKADLFIDNGLGLNDAVSRFADENLPAKATTVLLAETAVAQSELIAAPQTCHLGHCHNGLANPHPWLDPRHAAAYATAIGEAFAQRDPSNAAGYRSAAAALVEDLNRVDAAIEAAMGTIPAENRKLVVYHDAWVYFARRYGLKMVGAIQPADFSEPSAAEIRATVDQVRAQRVPAFFGSEVFPSSVLDTISAETGARYVPDLRDDRLPGDVGSAGHSYAGMMVANARAIVVALGGDDDALAAVTAR